MALRPDSRGLPSAESRESRGTPRLGAPHGQRGGRLSSKRFARSIPTARGVPDTFQDKEKCPFRCALRGEDRPPPRRGGGQGRGYPASKLPGPQRRPDKEAASFHPSASPGPSPPHAASRTLFRTKKSVRSDAHYVGRTGLRLGAAAGRDAATPHQNYPDPSAARTKRRPAFIQALRPVHPHRTRRPGHFSGQRKVSVPMRTTWGGPASASALRGGGQGRAATPHETARVPSPPGQWQQPAIIKNFARPNPGAHCAGKDRALFLRFSSLMPAPPRPPARGPGPGCRLSDRARRPSTAALPLPRRAVPPAGLRRSGWRR